MQDALGYRDEFLVSRKKIRHSPAKCGRMLLLPFSLWQQGEVTYMAHLVNFFLSVVASVVGYYICKWLDRHTKG